MKGKNVKGQIRDDSNSYYDNEYSFSISKEKYENAKNYAENEKKNPQDYNLYKNNCVDFSINVADKANVTLPNLPIGSSPTSLNDVLKIKVIK